MQEVDWKLGKLEAAYQEGRLPTLGCLGLMYLDLEELR